MQKEPYEWVPYEWVKTMPRGVPIVITGSDKWTDVRAILSVVQERRRQVEVEGWVEQDEDLSWNGELAAAAVCYAMPEAGRLAGFIDKLWPWNRRRWKPQDRRRDLVRAAALIVAEIERLDRAEAAQIRFTRTYTTFVQVTPDETKRAQICSPKPQP